jgi:hypothetical protein
MGELVLVNAEVLPFDTAFRLIQTLTAVPNTQVCSATVTSAVTLLQNIELQCPLVLDASLNPRQTSSNPPERFASAQDIGNLQRRYNAHYIPLQQVSEEELPETAFQRIYYALLKDMLGRRVVLLANESISRFGEWCPITTTPMLLIMQTAPQVAIKKALYMDVEVRTFLAPIDMQHYRPQHLQLLKEIPTLQADLQTAGRETRSESSGSELGNLREILSDLEQNVAKTIAELQTKAQDGDTVKKEFGAVWAKSKEGLAQIRLSQLEVLKAVADTKASAMSIIQSLSVRLEALETKAAGSAVILPVSRPVLTIAGAWRGTDSTLIIGIEKRKAYFISGILKVARAGTVIYQTEVNVGQMQLYQPVGVPETFQEGRYTTWVEYAEGMILSNSFDFDLQRGNTFADSLVNKRVGNLVEVETNLRDLFGEQRLALFHHLAATWTNEDEGQLHDFILSCLNQDLATEESLRADLQGKGMQFLSQ